MDHGQCTVLSVALFNLNTNHYQHHGNAQLKHTALLSKQLFRIRPSTTVLGSSLNYLTSWFLFAHWRSNSQTWRTSSPKGVLEINHKRTNKSLWCRQTHCRLHRFCHLRRIASPSQPNNIVTGMVSICDEPKLPATCTLFEKRTSGDNKPCRQWIWFAYLYWSYPHPKGPWKAAFPSNSSMMLFTWFLFWWQNKPAHGVGGEIPWVGSNVEATPQDQATTLL
jgi:hypothetical protein